VRLDVGRQLALRLLAGEPIQISTLGQFANCRAPAEENVIFSLDSRNPYTGLACDDEVMLETEMSIAKR
jgi:hypothetical protein